MDYTEKVQLLEHKVKIFYTVTLQGGSLFVCSANSEGPDRKIVRVGCSMIESQAVHFESEDRAQQAAALVQGTVHKTIDTLIRTSITETVI